MKRNGRKCPPHHWLLESPNGHPMLTGRCRRCRATGLFPAAFDAEATAWAKTLQAGSRKGQAMKQAQRRKP